jgi:hypothetical protein
LRRFSAILLVLLFGLSLLTPLLASGGESNLPACCRKAGLHHCGMPDGSAHDSGPAVRAQRCPMYPGFAPGTMSVVATVPVFASSSVSFAAEKSACSSFELLLLRSLADRAHAKRGPPCFVSA